MNARLTKEELLAALKAKLVEAKRYDAEQLAKHRVQYKKAAAARRAELRALIKLPDNKLAEANMYNALRNFDGAHCPMSEAKRIEQAIKWVQMDNRKSRLISTEAGDSKLLARILAWEPEPEDPTVCG